MNGTIKAQAAPELCPWLAFQAGRLYHFGKVAPFSIDQQPCPAMMRPRYIEDVIDLTDPALNHILNMSVEEARARVRSGDPKAVRAIEGSFALVARDGKTVRLARSMDRPMRYFLAKREDGPALVVAHRIEEIHRRLQSVGFADQFHPSYTRMVPAHYVVTLELIGCPDPAPAYTRFFEIPTETLPPDIPTIGRYYIEIG